MWITSLGPHSLLHCILSTAMREKTNGGILNTREKKVMMIAFAVVLACFMFLVNKKNELRSSSSRSYSKRQQSLCSVYVTPVIGKQAVLSKSSSIAQETHLSGKKSSLSKDYRTEPRTEHIIIYYWGSKSVSKKQILEDAEKGIPWRKQAVLETQSNPARVS